MATVLLFYKFAAPARYGLTVWLTPLSVKWLRVRGVAPQIAEEDKLRNLARQGMQMSRTRLSARMSRSRRRLTKRKTEHR